MIKLSKYIKLLLESDISERYAGSKKLRGIWYHGTSAKYLKSILSQGLIPDSKEKSWDRDDGASQSMPDRTTYGGVYVTRNLMTAYGAAWRVARKTNNNRLIVMIDLQSKSLIADEDNIVLNLTQYPEITALWYFKETKYPSDYLEYRKNLADAKKEWVRNVLSKFIDLYELKNEKIKQILKKYLDDEGFEAVLTRTVSYSTDKYLWHRNWDLRNIDKNDIPALPTPAEGEAVFRKFVDKLTRLLKSLVINKNSFAPIGRSLQPIRFTGSNKIVCIIELIEKKNEADKIKLVYGALPPDFIKQYRDRINSDFGEDEVIK